MADDPRHVGELRLDVPTDLTDELQCADAAPPPVVQQQPTAAHAAVITMEVAGTNGPSNQIRI